MNNLKIGWKTQTIEGLEKVKWAHLQTDTPFIKRIKELRKTPLNTFTTEDLRIAIGQGIALDYLIPIALEVLSKDLFAEGDFYEGDLLKNVLAIEPEFWQKNRNQWLTLNDLIKERLTEVAEKNIETTIFDNSK